MEISYAHLVMVVDDEKSIGRAITRLLVLADIDSIYKSCADEALELIKTSDRPFSLVMSDQKMPGMQGTEFLEQVKEIRPEPIRFLVTGHSDMDIISDSINKGAVHKYIVKPWDDNGLVQMIRQGLEQYEQETQRDRLFDIAKQKNKKLYKLNQDLVAITNEHDRIKQNRLKQIRKLKNRLLLRQATIEEAHKEMETVIMPNSSVNQKNLENFFSTCILKLRQACVPDVVDEP